MDKILIFTPTYNESQNIEKFIKDVKSQSLDLDILIIDDNSPDNTQHIVKDLMKFDDTIKLIVRKKKSGIDTAHKKAFNYALENNYDYFITMDSDLSHDPKEIRKFLEFSKKYDFVIGSRYMKGGGCGMKFYRYFLSKYGNLFIRYLLKINLYEFTTSYRCFNLKKMKNFNIDEVSASGYSFFMETVYLINLYKFKIKEIPIFFQDRKQGKSKISKIEILRTLYNLFLIKLNFKGNQL